MFTISADSKADVERWQDKVVKAGGTIVTMPLEIPEGYNLVFADLDGHRWNVFYRNPK